MRVWLQASSVSKQLSVKMTIRLLNSCSQSLVCIAGSSQTCSPRVTLPGLPFITSSVHNFQDFLAHLFGDLSIMWLFWFYQLVTFSSHLGTRSRTSKSEALVFSRKRAEWNTGIGDTSSVNELPLKRVLVLIWRKGVVIQDELRVEVV